MRRKDGREKSLREEEETRGDGGEATERTRRLPLRFHAVPLQVVMNQLDQRLCVLVAICLRERVWRQRHWASMELGCVLLVRYLGALQCRA